jgi:DNA-binding transcriptional regulator GbsR (MarR family)
MPTADSELTSREVSEVRDSFVQLWGSLGTFWGVSPTTARVFGWLFSQSEAADAEEIMAALELSRGAVSMACRELREWGLVHVEKTPGSRRVLYRAEADLEKVIRHVVEIRKRREWDPILENLREWIPQLEDQASPEASVLRQRLQSIEALVALGDTVVDRFLGGGTVSNFALRMLVGKGRAEARSGARTEENRVGAVSEHPEVEGLGKSS